MSLWGKTVSEAARLWRREAYVGYKEQKGRGCGGGGLCGDKELLYFVYRGPREAVRVDGGGGGTERLQDALHGVSAGHGERRVLPHHNESDNESGDQHQR